MKLLRVVLLVITYGLASASCLASSASQSLQITEASTGRALPHVTVMIDGKPVIADDSGCIDIPPSARILTSRTIGYWPYRTDVSSLHEKKIVLRPIAVHALYLTEYGVASKALREPVLDIIRKGGANALVITIKSDRGSLAYPSAIPLATQIGARKVTSIHSLPDLVADLHGRGIYLIARIVTFKDDPLATAHPEYGVHLGSGALFKDREHLSWTDPFRREVREYNIAIAKEAAQAGFDEVQFDYVRFPDFSQRLQFSSTADEAGRVKAIADFLREAHRMRLSRSTCFSPSISSATCCGTGTIRASVSTWKRSRLRWIMSVRCCIRRGSASAFRVTTIRSQPMTISTRPFASHSMKGTSGPILIRECFARGYRAFATTRSRVGPSERTKSQRRLVLQPTRTPMAGRSGTPGTYTGTQA